MNSLLFVTLVVAVTISAHPHHRHHSHHKYHQVSNGTYELATWEDGSFLSPPPQIPFHAEIIVPITNDPSIKLGVYVWLTGFAGDCPIQFYETTMRYIASQGVIIVGLDRLENINPYVEAPQLQTTINWISSGGLASEIASHNITVNIDLDAIIVGSHSSGAHTAVSMLLQECSVVKGLVLLSPVDGADPFGIVKEYCITPGTKVNFTLPMLNIVAGLDADHKPFAPACAPDFLSNNRFYDAMNGPVWQINGTGFGHADILDWIFPAAGGLVCYRNESLTQPELDVWRHAVAEMMWSFIGGILYGRTYLFDNLENPSYISTPVTLRYDYKSWTRESLIDGFCKHTNTTIDQQDEKYVKYHNNIHHHHNKHHDEKKHHHQHHEKKH